MNTKVKFIDYKKDYLRFKKEYDNVWEDVNMRGDLILRKDVAEFEERLAKYVGTKYAVALSSGTDAIFLALKALKIKGNVAVPCKTFKATCGAVINAGCQPILYDLDNRVHGQILCDAIIKVHIAGEICDLEIDKQLHPAIIEDACQAFGSLKNPTSEIQCWSFYPAKLCGVKGDAGAITTNDPVIYEYIKEYRNHFKDDNRDFGGNHRMDNLQAALLNVKIQHIDEIITRRQDIAKMYFDKLPVDILPSSNNKTFQDFILRVGEKRDELYNFLKENGIETIKNEYPFSPEYPKLPLTAKYESETLRIPNNENLIDEEVEYIISKINEFYSAPAN
jgi:dTDP-4-amino-4,6-dideoxygalactose transaminase